MLETTIPGFGPLEADYLVLDLNGTLAADGILLEGVKERLNDLARLVSVIVVTADTFGLVRRELAGVDCKTELLTENDQDIKKAALIDRLGADRCVAIGNGRNDSLMLNRARLGICVVQQEGAASKTLAASDVICTDIRDALDLLRFPKRLTATLRT
ncbi:MAG: ATPase P [Desulfobacteraceae bacterium]|nr:ATPase P [Desulfobacteraceae bacterium]